MQLIPLLCYAVHRACLVHCLGCQRERLSPPEGCLHGQMCMQAPHASCSESSRLLSGRRRHLLQTAQGSRTSSSPLHRPV